MRERGARRVAAADLRLLRTLEDWPLGEDAGWRAPSGVRALGRLAVSVDRRHAIAGIVIGVAMLVTALTTA